MRFACDNDRLTQDVPNINLTREMTAANCPGPGVKGWNHEKVMPTLTRKPLNGLPSEKCYLKRLAGSRITLCQLGRASHPATGEAGHWVKDSAWHCMTQSVVIFSSAGPWNKERYLDTYNHHSWRKETMACQGSSNPFVIR